MRPLWLLLLVFGTAVAQSDSFAVASVKPNNSLTEAMGGGIVKGGRVALRNYTLKHLVGMAYGVQDYRILSGPGWITLARYDIEAKPASPVDYPQAQLLLRALLADRFDLRVRHQTKAVPGYTLNVEKGGAKLPRSTKQEVGFGIMSPEEIRGPGDMAMFARVLTATLGAPVEDQTALTGAFDVELKWKLETSTAAPLDTSAASEPALSIFTAIKQQLGLRLTPAKVPVDMIVIDHAEKPTPN